MPCEAGCSAGKVFPAQLAAAKAGGHPSCLGLSGPPNPLPGPVTVLDPNGGLVEGLSLPINRTSRK